MLFIMWAVAAHMQGKAALCCRVDIVSTSCENLAIFAVVLTRCCRVRSLRDADVACSTACREAWHRLLK